MEYEELAKQAFNATWDLIDKTERTANEDLEMLHLAHTSCYAWSKAASGKPINVGVGEWQIAKCYALLGEGSASLRHAVRYLEIVQAENAGAFHLAFAYEGIARAYSILKDIEQTASNKALGLQSVTDIADEEDRKYAIGELEGI